MGSTQLPPHLHPGRDIHVVISVLSGNHNAQAYYDETLKPFLDTHSIKYLVHITKSTQTIIELTQSLFLANALRGIKQTVILLSGDGGVVDIINTLTTNLQRSSDDLRAPSIFIRPVIALIPQGTANALAWSSGVASDPLATLINGRAVSLPIFEVVFSQGARLITNEGQDREVINSHGSPVPKMYGAVVFSWGLHASLVARSDTIAFRKHGLARFKMAAEQLLDENHAYAGLVRVQRPAESHTRSSEWESLYEDDGGNCKDHAYILASLVSNLEEKFKISPSSAPLDGKLRIVGIKHLPAKEVARLLFLPYQDGKHVEDSHVTYKEIDGLRIEFLEEDEQWREVCIDGKIVSVEQGGWVEVKRLPAQGVDGRRVVEVVI